MNPIRCMSPEPKPATSNFSSSRKKMKIDRSDERDIVGAFDLAEIDAVLDLECDIEKEYNNRNHGEEENIKPNENVLHSSDYCNIKKKDDSFSGVETKNSLYDNDVVEDNETDTYIDYLSRARKHLNYLNALEEDEEKTFSARAKLFEYVNGRDYFFDTLSSHLFESNQEDGPARWAQRGTGQVKFLRHLEEGITYGTVRIAMHHEGTLKLLMNHLVEPGLEVTSTKDARGRRHYMWCTLDNALGCAQRTFALRFANERDALSWKQHFEQSKKATADARLALDPECYAPPGTPQKDKLNADGANFYDEISKSLPFTPATKLPFLQKRRRFID